MHEAEAVVDLSACQRTPAIDCLEDMCKLHAMVWQQQPSNGVIQRMKEVQTQPMCPAAQESVLQLLNSPVCKAAPPSLQYVARLVKQLIAAAEEQQQELSDPLLELKTALILPSSSTASALQEPATWRYKTFYYSTSPSWQELQHLQNKHCKHINAAVRQSSSSSNILDSSSNVQDSSSSSSSTHRTQAAASVPIAAAECSQRAMAEDAGWTVPAHLQQRLLQRQETLQQLLSAVQWQQPVHVPPGPVYAAALQNAVAQQPHQQQVPTSTSSRHLSSNSGGRSSWRHSGLITVHSSDNMFEGGTGCHMWDAGFLLAEFVLNNRHIFEGKRVLEIGCGPGLVATCLCRTGVSRVLLTDGDPQTLVNCLSNLSLNGHTDGTLLGSWRAATDVFARQETRGSSVLQRQVWACPLDWEEHVPGLSADVVVGSDICYDPEAVPSLVNLLQQLLARRGTAQHSSKLQRSAQRDAAGGACGAACSSNAGDKDERRVQGSMQDVQVGLEAAEAAAAAAAAAPAGVIEACGGMGSTFCDGATEGPVAYISTTKRQGSTLQLFLDECAAAGLDVQEMPKVPSAWLLRRDSDKSGAELCGSGCVGSGLATAPAGPVVFQELPALKGEGRELYVLHRVQMRV